MPYIICHTINNMMLPYYSGGWGSWVERGPHSSTVGRAQALLSLRTSIRMRVWSAHIARVWINRVWYGCQSCSWSAEQGKRLFPCPRPRLGIWSREAGSAVPSRASPLISTLWLNHQSGAYSYSQASLLPPAFRDIYYIYYR